MLTRNYRTEAAVVAAPRGRPNPFDGPIGQLVTLSFPIPPTFNVMIEWAKERRYLKGGKGRWVPRYYAEQQDYKALAKQQLMLDGHRPGSAPWDRWSMVEIVFASAAHWDPLEMQSGAKWPTDLLVTEEYVKGDASTHLTIACQPAQLVSRAGPHSLTLTIRRDA
jgi:hypothetical protein